MNYIQPDKLFTIPIQGGELNISPSCDVMHHLPNDAWMLKYWDLDSEPPKLCNVFMDSGAAAALIEMCELEVCERKVMRNEEHSQWVGWAALHELDGLDFDVPDAE